MEFAIEITPIVAYLGVVFPFIGLLSFLFFDDLEGIASISVAIKSGISRNEIEGISLAALLGIHGYINMKLSALTSHLYWLSSFTFVGESVWGGDHLSLTWHELSLGSYNLSNLRPVADQ